MIIQAVKAAKFSLAEIALESKAIPSHIRSHRLHTATVTWQLDHRLRNNINAVQLANSLVDPMAIKARGAATGFQMDNHTGGVREWGFAEWAGHGGVGLGMHVLQEERRGGISLEVSGAVCCTVAASSCAG